MSVPPVLRTHCPACGKPLTPHERFAGGLCGDWQCKRLRTEAEQRRLLTLRMEALRDAAEAQAAPGSARRTPVIKVRWYDTGLVPVPESQRDSLQRHLLALQPEVDALAAAEAAALPDDDPPPPAVPNPEVDALLGQVCARCTGYCCRMGFGRQAFLDAAALWRVWQQWPEASYVELVDSYLAALPALHHAGSCGFHGEQGCVLPRERRADICNSFECPGLEQTRRLAELQGVRRVFVVRHDAEHDPIGAFAPPL